MSDNETERLVKYITVAAEIYGKQLSKEAIKLYIAMLKGYQFSEIERAIQKCLGTREMFPVPAAIINELTHGDDINVRAELAWSYVLDVISVCGIYESFTFKDKATRKALSLVDYEIELCLCPRAELHWKKRDFIESYKAFAGLNGNFDAPNYFAGIVELNNSDKYEEAIGKNKIYLPEENVFIYPEELNKKIEGFKPELKLLKNIKKTLLNS
ncbi:MAG: hypothetical protein ACYCSQ_00675 [bacterium]